jgi:hypothetical protein
VGEELRIGRDGCLAIPAPAAHVIGERPLQLASWSGQHLLLAAADSPRAVLLAGTLGEVGTVDLLSFCNMFRKSGLLHFRLAGGDKSLYFHNGEIAHASSTFPEEEIGEVLYDLGKLDREALLVARRLAAGKVPLGKFLVEQGTVSTQDLWTATRSMVETIVCSLFTYQRGDFVLLDQRLAEGLAVRLAMNTQALIMEGVRRIDERAFYLQRISSLDAVPVASAAVPADLDNASRKLLALISAGSGPAREVLRRSGLGDFDGLRLLSRLVERGAVTMEEPPPAAVDGDLAEILAIFNGVLATLYRAVSACNPQFRNEISHFLRDLPPPYSYVFRQAAISEDGAVDGHRLAANLAGLERGDRLRLLTDALNELVYMECLALRRELGTADSAELIRRVQDVTQRVQILIGRYDHG